MIKKKESGQVLLLAVIIVGLILINTLVIISGSQLFSQNTNYNLQAAQAVNLAEAGIDKAVASLNTSGGSYNGEDETSLGPGSYSVNIISKDPSTVIIESSGFVPSKATPKAKKTITMQASKGVGISFVYGLFVGEGGISMGNTSIINGSVYSNGNIVGGNNESITGDVYVAGGVQPVADQQSDCSSPGCSDFIFGKNVGGDNRADIAQSFKPSISEVINKVSLKIKKTGSPSNITVRLLADDNGNPDKNNILASGTLAANLVTDQYGFIDVTFSSSPQLTLGTTYWIMVTTNLNSNNYWSWSLDTLQGYTQGNSMWSSDWQDKNPVWNNISGDLGFKIFMGGIPTSITMNNGSIIGGNVHANTISGLTVNKDAYYQSINNSVVRGVSYPNSVDPPPITMPISDANIAKWQDEAEEFGVTTGDVSGCPTTLGPGKIVGNLISGNNCTIIVKTPIWITGDLTVGNSVIFRMDSSMGASSGVIIVDGLTNFSNGDDLRGTGIAGSYLTLLSTYNSQSSGNIAINTGNSSITGILYAPFGIISLSNNANFKEAVAWKLNMGTGTVLTYDSGLVSTFFSAGPGGSFSIVKGTYQEK